MRSFGTWLFPVFFFGIPQLLYVLVLRLTGYFKIDILTERNAYDLRHNIFIFISKCITSMEYFRKFKYHSVYPDLDNFNDKSPEM